MQKLHLRGLENQPDFLSGDIKASRVLTIDRCNVSPLVLQGVNFLPEIYIIMLIIASYKVCFQYNLSCTGDIIFWFWSLSGVRKISSITSP